jgi:5-methylcytosine-specific restriction endonuclease McrA
MTVNDATRKFVRVRAKYLCEYCHSNEEASAALFAIDHIIPQSLPGSSDDVDNLALVPCGGNNHTIVVRASCSRTI